MKTRSWLVVPAFFLILLTTVGFAWGQPESQALLLEKAGELLFKASRYREAAEKFREVIENYTNPPHVILTARWNLARCLEEMGDDVSALAAFGDFERHAKTEQEKEDAAKKIEQIRERLRAEIAIELEPDGAMIRLDGEELGQAPLSRTVRVEPGLHTLECEKEGYRPVVEPFEVHPRERRTIRVVLVAKVGKIAMTAPARDTGPVMVFVDDKTRYSGKLPIEILETEGHHRVVVRTEEGFVVFDQEVDVPDEGRVEVSLRFPEVPVSVLSAPAPSASTVAPPLSPSVGIQTRPSSRFGLSVALTGGLGFARYQGNTARTHANVEVGVAAGFSTMEWLRPELAVAASVETLMVLARPGIRWYLGSPPLFFRTAGEAILAPVRAGGILVGMGADIPVSSHLTVPVEGDLSLWPSAFSLVVMEFRVGAKYAF